MTDTPVEQTPEQAAADQGTPDPPAATAQPTSVHEVLQAFLDIHSPRKTGHATNANGSWETDETVYCQCPLCVNGRAALSA